MPSLTDRFSDLTDNIKYKSFTTAYETISTCKYIDKKIYYNTDLYKGMNGVYEIYYHGNKIITYTSNSIKLTNTYYFGQPSTKTRVNKLLPKCLDIQCSKNEVFVYCNLEHRLVINSKGYLDYVKSSNTRYYRMISQPLFEGIEFIKVPDGHDTLDIKQTQEWFEKYKKNTGNKPVFLDIYKELLQESLIRNYSLHLYVETERHLYKNNVIVTNPNQKLPKLSKDYSYLINEILDKYNLYSIYPITFTLDVDGDSMSNIDKTKKLIKILNAA